MHTINQALTFLIVLMVVLLKYVSFFVALVVFPGLVSRPHKNYFELVPVVSVLINKEDKS